ncbi:LysE family translocator [Hydrogenophaga sp.]|uniref:LysE family translocator n=1 Tax=Hydrogenophaga sp. TaxID=1904254 RepID=UPI00286DC7A3|nr:LysE family translocator [Hydrogenophaga sp.]
MPSLQTLLMFATASLALAVIPGPTMLLALSNGMGGGLRRAAWGMAGANLGSVIVISVVAVGLGALLASSAWLFEAVRAVGVLYLLWLAVQLWRSPPQDVRAALAQVPGQQMQGRAAFVRSLLVALSNPKSLLFFAAFLPQFVDPAQAMVPQYALLGALFVAIDALVMVAYALAGRQAVRWLSGDGLRWLHRGCAVGMGLLALLLASVRRQAA